MAGEGPPDEGARPRFRSVIVAPWDKARLAHAKRMRTSPSVMEAQLWRLLRNRRLEGIKFRRQVPIGRYVAAFVCFRHRLIVEADGPFHDPDKDAIRDAWLRSQGFRLLRFPNQQIDQRGHEVIAAILAAVEPRSGAV